jgi:hypothetical protein
MPTNPENTVPVLSDSPHVLTNASDLTKEAAAIARIPKLFTAVYQLYPVQHAAKTSTYEQWENKGKN